MTAAANLRRDIREVGDDCYWAVFGPAGVICWGLLSVTRSSSCFGPIGIHSPRPLFPGSDPDEQAYDGCEFLEMACYSDAGYLAGEHLGKRWDAAGRDDEVIWAELEEWYAGRLATLAVTR